MDMKSILSTIKFSLTTVILALGINLVWKFINIVFQYKRDVKQLQCFPSLPKHWLLGNIRDFPYGKGVFRSIHFVRKYGAAFVVQIGPFHKILGLYAPHYIQKVLNTSEPKDDIYQVLEPWIGDGLLLSKGKKWARNRRLLTPAFHFDILKPYQSVFSDCAMTMLNKWKKMAGTSNELYLEMFEHVSLMTLDSLMKCIFGVYENFQTLEGKRNPYIASVYTLTELALQRMRFPPYHNNLIYYFSPGGFRNRRAIASAHKYSQKVINKKINEKAKQLHSDRKYLDFLDILLECKDEDGKGLTMVEIQNEVDTFMFEGHDTTASGISWCLYNLARHPQYQDRCREEIISVLGDSDEVKWEDLNKLNYLTMCIKESLRITPPVSAVSRLLTKEIDLPDGRTIPAGTRVILGIYACHHNQEYWDNPEIYNPERFNPDNAEKKHTHAFIPFSAGPRNCIGQNFALNELKTCMALVLKHFRLELDGSRITEPFSTLILRAQDGLWLKLEAIG